jgi:hypothetical protein
MVCRFATRLIEATEAQWSKRDFKNHVPYLLHASLSLETRNSPYKIKMSFSPRGLLADSIVLHFLISLPGSDRSLLALAIFENSYRKPSLSDVGSFSSALVAQRRRWITSDFRLPRPRELDFGSALLCIVLRLKSCGSERERTPFRTSTSVRTRVLSVINIPITTSKSNSEHLRLMLLLSR